MMMMGSKAFSTNLKTDFQHGITLRNDSKGAEECTEAREARENYDYFLGLAGVALKCENGKSDALKDYLYYLLNKKDVEGLVQSYYLICKDVSWD